MTRKIGWGIAGLGNIAHKFTADLKRVPQAKLVAVASSSGKRAEAFAATHKAEKAYDSYEALYLDPAVEVIYIASLNPLHHEMTLAALQAGKGVLCEKPLGLNPTEIKQMIALSKKQNCFLMEGLWSRFNAAIQRAKQWIDEGQIGIPKYLYAEFSFYRLGAEASHRLMDPKKGGGVLLDIGVYPLFLAYLILGIPVGLDAQSHFSDTGVDIQTAMLLQYKNAQAVLYCGIANESDNNAKIGGTEGQIVLHGMWHNAQSVELIKDGVSEKKDFPSMGNGFVPQIEEVNRCIASGKTESEWWSHQDAMNLGLLVDRVFQKIRH